MDYNNLTFRELCQLPESEQPRVSLMLALTRYKATVISTIEAECRLLEHHRYHTQPTYNDVMELIGILTDTTLSVDLTPPERINYPNFDMVITDVMLHGGNVDDKLSNIMAGISVKTAKITSGVCDMWHDTLWEATDNTNSIARRVTAGVKAVGLFVPTLVSKLHGDSVEIEKARNIHKLTVTIAYAQAAVEAVCAELERFYEEAMLHCNGASKLITAYAELITGSLEFNSIERKKRLMTLCNTARLLKRCVERQVTY